MKSLFRAIAGLAMMSLPFTACSHPADVYPAGQPIPAVSSGGVVTTRADPAEIMQVNIAGDQLRIAVRHAGGCRDHIFSLLPSNVFLESLPVQMSVQLTHDARGDPCRALVGQELVFDLTPIRRTYQEAYRTERGVVMLRIWAPGGTEPHPGLARYEF